MTEISWRFRWRSWQALKGRCGEIISIPSAHAQLAKPPITSFSSPFVFPRLQANRGKNLIVEIPHPPWGDSRLAAERGWRSFVRRKFGRVVTSFFCAIGTEAFTVPEPIERYCKAVVALGRSGLGLVGEYEPLVLIR